MTIVERAIEKLRRQGSSGPQAPEQAIEPSIATVPVAEADDASVPRLAIDREGLRLQGYAAEAGVDREISSQFRRIKRPLVAAAHAPLEAGAPDPRRIMVTSALPGEGKTFTSIQLAFSLALERDHTVLLVDGDVARPRLSRVLGLGDRPGLLDLVADGQRRASELVIPTDVPGLYVLPSGQPREGSAELVASSRMAGVMDELADMRPRQLVVMDSPPVLVSGEARTLAAISGQVVLVVRSGVTLRSALTHALAALGPKRRPRLVLNECHVGSGDVYAHDGYYGNDQEAGA